MKKLERWVSINGELGFRVFESEAELKLFKMWRNREVFDTRLEAIEFTREKQKVTVDRLAAEALLLCEAVNRQSIIDVKERGNRYELTAWEIGETLRNHKQDLTTANVKKEV